MGLNDLDEQIRTLQRQLAAAESEPSTSSSSSSSATTSSAEEAEAEAEALESIPPLPEYLLPEFYARAKAPPAKRPRLGGGGAAPGGGGRRADAEAEAEALPEGHEAPRCKVCNAVFAGVAALLEHRETREHKRREQAERRATYCALCAKQFTSRAQLAEHCEGKWHLMRKAKRDGVRLPGDPHEAAKAALRLAKGQGASRDPPSPPPPEEERKPERTSAPPVRAQQDEQLAGRKRGRRGGRGRA